MSIDGLFSVSGKTVLVTGASYGLGAVMAAALAEAGANVVLAARSKERIEGVAREIQAGGGAALPVVADIGDPASVRAMIDAGWARYGRVDVVVNNAGVAAEAGVVPEKVPDDLFEQTIRVNLLGTWYCCREAGARWLADGRGGSIINVASVLGLTGGEGMPQAYQASKAAVVNITRGLAASWGDRGIRVNCIAPGWFPSEMTNPWFAIPQFLARVQAQAALRRIGDPRELIGPLLFLASDASSFVTGQTLAVDGGLTASAGAAPIGDELYEVFAAVVPAGLGARILPGSA